MATGWSQAQVDWLKKNDPKKLAGGYKPSYTGGQGTLQGGGGGGGYSMQPAKPSGGGGGLQWNANELAWAKQHGVNLGQKTAGGLSTNAQYQKITGTGGGGAAGGGQKYYGGGQAAGYGYQDTSGKEPSAFGGALGAGLGYLGGGGVGFATGAGLSSAGLGLAAGLGPIGWAVGGALLGASLLGNKKKDYHEQGATGDTNKWGFRQVGGVDPNTVDFNKYVNDPINKDLRQAASSFREGTASASDIGYWQRRASSVGAGDVTKMTDAQFARLHFEFDAQGEGPRASEYRLRVAKPAPPPKPKARSAPAPVATASIAAPEPIDPGKPIEKPKDGLENTIKRTSLEGESIVRNYLGPGRDSVFIKEDEESRKRRKKAYGAALMAAR